MAFQLVGAQVVGVCGGMGRDTRQYLGQVCDRIEALACFDSISE